MWLLPSTNHPTLSKAVRHRMQQLDVSNEEYTLGSKGCNWMYATNNIQQGLKGPNGNIHILCHVIIHVKSHIARS